MPAPLITISHLSKTFVLHHVGKRLASVRDCSFVVPAGTLTALVGPSGAGKSTVLKCLYRTYLPCSGSIMLRTGTGLVDVATADERTVLALRRTDLAFVTQFLHALPRQPTWAVVAAPLLAHGMNIDEARAGAVRALTRLAVPERLWDLPPATFSGGERARVNLARGLTAQPRVLLLDEPTASLDARSVGLVRDAIHQAKADGITIVAIFHDQEVVRELADHVVELIPPQQEAA